MTRAKDDLASYRAAALFHPRPECARRPACLCGTHALHSGRPVEHVQQTGLAAESTVAFGTRARPKPRCARRCRRQYARHVAIRGPALVQSLFGDKRPAGDPRIGRRHARLGQATSRLCSGIFPDYAAPIVRNQPDGRELTMARWGMPSPVFALKGTQLRSRRHQYPQRQIPALAALARRREPLRRAFHQLLRERDAAGRHQASGLVRLRRDAAARLLRRHLDALDLRPEGEGRRDDKRYFRIPDDRTKQGGRRHPPKGDACHFDRRARKSISG